MLNYTEFSNLIKFYLENDDLAPLFIEGESGIGKTQITEAVALSLGFKPFVVQLGTKTLEYFMGLPSTIEVDGVKETQWTRPEVVFQINSFCEEKEGNKALLFIDDFHLAGEEERKIMFELLPEHSIHGFPLHKNVKIMLAANPHSSEYGSTVSELPKPVSSRIMLYELRASFEQWKAVSMEKGVSPLLLSFLEFNKSYFLGERGKNSQYPCPRAWWNLSAYLEKGAPITAATIKAAVGDSAAAEFMAFYNVYQGFETKKPESWMALDYQNKAALASYLIMKKDISLIRKYHEEMKADDSSRPLLVMLWKFLSSVEDKEFTEFFEKELPYDILQDYL